MLDILLPEGKHRKVEWMQLSDIFVMYHNIRLLGELCISMSVSELLFIGVLSVNSLKEMF